MATRSQKVFIILLFLVGFVYIFSYFHSLLNGTPGTMNNSNIIFNINVDKMLGELQQNLTKNLESLDKHKRRNNLIITTFRSGSTFLGEAVQQQPGAFYHFEPLAFTGNFWIKSAKDASHAVGILEKLLGCDYSNLGEYLDFGSVRDWHNKNGILEPFFQSHPDLRTNGEFMSRACSMFPFQLAKVVRLPLEYLEALLQNKELDVQVLYLVRDPRGTFNSRLKELWCKSGKSDECSDPKHLCENLQNDFKTAEKFKLLFPDRFTSIKYEDLALNPHQSLREVYNFFGVTWTSTVETFIQTHTDSSQNSTDSHSTFRDSKSNTFKWKEYFNAHEDELQHLQSVCGETMKLWNYELYYPQNIR